MDPNAVSSEKVYSAVQRASGERMELNSEPVRMSDARYAAALSAGDGDWDVCAIAVHGLRCSSNVNYHQANC